MCSNPVGLNVWFLAHLSLQAHWWAYSIGMLRCPSVCPPFSKFFFSKTAGPVEAKFHVEPPWVRGTKVCLGHLGHMTKIANMPIYGKNPSKIFFFGTKGPMTLGLGMRHWVLRPIKVCSNDDLGLTLTYFMARSNLVPYAFIWEKPLESHLIKETYSKWPEWHEVYVYIKILTKCIKSDFKEISWKLATDDESCKACLLASNFWPKRVVCPCPGTIYMWKNIKKYA